MNAMLQTMTGLAAVAINTDSEYAGSFGIKKGDTVFLQKLRFAEDGDLLLLEINGGHQLERYNEIFTELNEHTIGVLVASMKIFKEIAGSADEEMASDDLEILSAEILE